jgi:hypothetical protein
MPDQLEARVVEQVDDVPARASVEVVHAYDLVATLEQPIAEMAAEEARPACDENSLG